MFRACTRRDSANLPHPLPARLLLPSDEDGSLTVTFSWIITTAAQKHTTRCNAGIGLKMIRLGMFVWGARFSLPFHARAAKLATETAAQAVR